MTNEGRKNNILRTAFYKGDAETSDDSSEQRCNVMPSRPRQDRKRLNRRSFFAALRRECKAVFQNSTSERLPTPPRSTSTTPVETSETPVSTSTTIYSTSTSITDIDHGARVSVRADKVQEAQADLEARIEAIKAKLDRKYNGDGQSSSSTGSGRYEVNSTSTTRASPVVVSRSGRESTSSVQISSSTSGVKTARSNRSRKSASQRYQSQLANSSSSFQEGSYFQPDAELPSSSSSIDNFRTTRRNRSKQSAAERYQRLLN